MCMATKKGPNKRIFIIATADPTRASAVQKMIEKHVSRATIYLAEDGKTALQKVENAPPQVLVADIDLPKLDGLALVDEILSKKDLAATAFLVVGTPPEEGRHLDELVTGRLNYWTNLSDESEFTTRMLRSLNFSTHREDSEFFLRFIAKNEMLLREGDRAEYVYFVMRGKLMAFSEKSGDRVDLGHIESGEFVGEMAYINGEPRSASVMAETDCELIEVPLDRFSNVLFKRPSWSKALMVTLSRRLKAANQERLKSN